jgi:hypothetical protein
VRQRFRWMTDELDYEGHSYSLSHLLLAAARFFWFKLHLHFVGSQMAIASSVPVYHSPLSFCSLVGKDSCLSGRLFKKTNKGDTRLPLQDDEIWAEKSTSDQYLNSVSSTRGRRWIELFLLLLPRRTKGLSLMIGSLQHIYLNPCE